MNPKLDNINNFDIFEKWGAFNFFRIFEIVWWTLMLRTEILKNGKYYFVGQRVYFNIALYYLHKILSSFRNWLPKMLIRLDNGIS